MYTITDQFFASFPINQYEFKFEPPLSIPEAWVSVYGIEDDACEFTWMGSPIGDGIIYIPVDDPDEVIPNFDMSLCLTAPEPPPAVSVVAQDASASETDGDAGTFRITRTGDTAASLTVHFTLEGTATNGTDYQTISGTATIEAQAAFEDVLLTPMDDTDVEGSETAILILSADANYTIGTPASAEIVLLDDETTRDPADVDGSGKVDATDIELVVNEALGMATGFAQTCDINGDGDVNAVDVQLVINAVLTAG